MLQPDLFFAYGLSSGLALAARKKLRKEDKPFVNKYFIGTMLWLSVFYVPQVIYLLFRFPAWESMFAIRDLSDLPAWFISLYFVAVMVMGFLGYFVTLALLRRGKLIPAHALSGLAFLAATVIVLVGWDGTGYQRLLYTGTGADWAAGVEIPLLDFFKSNIFITLLWLEGLVLAPYAVLLVRWGKESMKEGA